MIEILHAWSDRMNLYGDYANVTLLRRRLEAAGFEARVRAVAAGGALDLRDCRLLYIGAGTEGALLRALDEMEQSREAVRRYAGDGGRILATGNAIGLLGGAVQTPDGTPRRGAGLLDCDITIRPDRRYGECILASDLCQAPVVGAINTSLKIRGAAPPLFGVEYATNRELIHETEGMRGDGVWATQLTGPLLVRNPALLDAVAALLAGQPLPPCQADWYAHAVAGHARMLETLRAEQAKRR